MFIFRYRGLFFRAIQYTICIQVTNTADIRHLTLFSLWCYRVIASR